MTSKGWEAIQRVHFCAMRSQCLPKTVHLSTEEFQVLLSANVAMMEAKMKLELKDQMKELLVEELWRLAGSD